MVCHGRMSELAADVTEVLRATVQQQTVMLHVQAESVRLQRVLVERLLGSPGVGPGTEAPALVETTSSVTTTPLAAIDSAPAAAEPTSPPGQANSQGREPEARVPTHP
jgi:hypothetical protein